MRTALDTNILSAILSGEARAREITQALLDAKHQGALLISGVVYAELIASPYVSESTAERFLMDTGVRAEFDLSEAVWTEAGRRFKQYSVRRRRSEGGEAKRLLADFLVGSHALLQADRLMTLDGRRYQTDFPELRLYPLSA